MKIVKRCAYCATCYNLLPTVLLTPLHRMTCLPDMQPENTDAMRDPERKQHWHRAGFRLALKFWCWHLGIEVHYCS